MRKYLNKRNIYITLFALLYILCSICSLIHSFAFFGLANNLPMSIMLGTCFELGQFAVLMSLLTSKRNDGKIMPYILLITLTIVQVLGNVFSSYKYLMLNSVSDLTYFKTPIFIFTDLPDNITTVIVTWVIGAILPVVCLLLTSMVSNYIMDNNPEDNKNILENEQVTETDVLNKEDKETKKEEVSIIQETPSLELSQPEQQAKENIEQDIQANGNDIVNKTNNNEEGIDEPNENDKEDEEAVEDSNNKEDDGITKENEESNTRLQEDVNRTDETDNEVVNKEKKVHVSKPHFLNLN